MQQLLEGYHLFRATYFFRHRDMFGQLAQRQSPKTMVISCCDSRVDPGLIFNAQPGEIFTLRNVANLVPPFSPDDSYHGTSAAIEFAVVNLKVERIVILGHTRCGGVRALLGDHEGDFIGPWMRIAEPARTRSIGQCGDAPLSEVQRYCELETLRISLQNLRTFPWIRTAVEAGRLKLLAWQFNIEEGELLGLNEETGQFEPL